MKTKNILAVVVATLVISTALFAGPGQSPAKDQNTPTTDGAIWGNSVSGSAEGAVSRGNDPSTSSAHTNPLRSHEPNPSAQGSYNQSLVDFLKSLAKGLGVLTEGAIWG